MSEDRRESLADLAARAAQQDEEAARALVRGLYPLVIKIVRAHLPRRTDEEDLAQMVFGRVFAHLGQYSGGVPIEHWVSRIAVNCCWNALRAERRRPELRVADLTEQEAEVVEKVLTAEVEAGPAEQVAARDLVSRLLGTLSPADRLLLQRLDFEGRSVEEVRRETGWSTSLIKVRAFRARRRLRRVYAGLERAMTHGSSTPGVAEGHEH